MFVKRDAKGWKIKNRFLTFHPISYGTGTLARLSLGLRPSGRRLMLHYFPTQDYATTFHDHPWSFRTLVIWGKYIDQSLNSYDEVCYDVLHIGSIRFRAAQHRHRTRVLTPTVTVVLAGSVQRSWCEGTATDWKCEGNPEAFNETLGHIPPYESQIIPALDELAA